MKRSRLFSYVILAALVVMALSACDDDDDGPVDSRGTIGIYGSWTVVSGADQSYLLFNTDNTYDFLTEYDQGFHEVSSDVFLATESQVMLSALDPFDVGEGKEYETEEALQGPIFGVWNYFVTNDTLVLWTPEDTIRAINDISAPTADEWMPWVTLVDTFPAPHQSDVDMDWHDGSLWYGNARATDYIYRLNTGTGDKVDSIFSSRSAYSLDWVDTNLWVSSNGFDGVYNIDTASGIVRNTIANMGAWPYGMANSGNTLYVYCNNGRHLYVCDASSNSIIDSIQMSIPLQGLAIQGTSLWATSSTGDLYRIPLWLTKDGSASQQPVVAESYRFAGHRAFGLAFDGNRVWVAAYDRDYNAYIGGLVFVLD